MIEAKFATHIVMDQRRIGARPQNIDLRLVERRHLVRAIPAEIHHMGRVRLGHGLIGQLDLVIDMVTMFRYLIKHKSRN